MTPLALHASGCDELLETKSDQHADRKHKAKMVTPTYTVACCCNKLSCWTPEHSQQAPCVSRGTCRSRPRSKVRLQADKNFGSLKADQHADRTAQGRDGDTNVHSRVAVALERSVVYQ